MRVLTVRIWHRWFASLMLACYPSSYTRPTSAVQVQLSIYHNGVFIPSMSIWDTRAPSPSITVTYVSLLCGPLKDSPPAQCLWLLLWTRCSATDFFSKTLNIFVNSLAEWRGEMEWKGSLPDWLLFCWTNTSKLRPTICVAPLFLKTFLPLQWGPK